MRFAEFHPIETEHLLLRKLELGDVYEYYERLMGDKGQICCTVCL